MEIDIPDPTGLRIDDVWDFDTKAARRALVIGRDTVICWAGDDVGDRAFDAAVARRLRGLFASIGDAS